MSYNFLLLQAVYSLPRAYQKCVSVLLVLCYCLQVGPHLPASPPSALRLSPIAMGERESMKRNDRRGESAYSPTLRDIVSHWADTQVCPYGNESQMKRNDRRGESVYSPALRDIVAQCGQIRRSAPTAWIIVVFCRGSIFVFR